MARTQRFLSLPVAVVAAGFFFGVSNAAEPGSDTATQAVGGTIDQVVVVAHKDERSIREIAANVTVLSRAQIDAQMSTSAADLFRYVPGVDHEGAGNRFGAEGINIRGIGGNRVAIVRSRSCTVPHPRCTAVRRSVAWSRCGRRTPWTSREAEMSAGTRCSPGGMLTTVGMHRRSWRSGQIQWVSC
jgi:hypothetical protein